MNILMIGGISDPEEGERMKDWKNLGMQSKISHETERNKKDARNGGTDGPCGFSRIHPCVEQVNITFVHTSNDIKHIMFYTCT